MTEKLRLGPMMASLPTDKMRAFVRAMVELGMTPPEAALNAGYKDSAAKSIGYQLATDPRVQDAIREQAAALLRIHGPTAIAVLEQLVRHPAVDNKTRLAAAREILDRGGLPAAHEQKIEVAVVDNARDPRTVAAEIVAMGRALGVELDPRHLLGAPADEPIDAEFVEVPDDLKDILQ